MYIAIIQYLSRNGIQQGSFRSVFKKGSKANSFGKILSIDNSGTLVLKEAEDIFLRQEDKKYVNAYKNLGEAIESYRFKKQHYEMAERGNVELFEIRRLKGTG